MLRSTKVSEYMATRLLTFLPQTDVFHAMSQLLDSGYSGAPVVDEKGTLMGMLSEVDCMECMLNDGYYSQSGGVVSQYMTENIDTIDPNADIITLAQYFKEKHRRRLPVVRNGVLLGQISRRDVLRAIRDFSQSTA